MKKPTPVIIEISQLKPYKKNARKHSEKQVELIGKSLLTYGFLNPVLIDDKKMIIAGHGRIEAAKKIGLTEAPCIEISHLTPEQKREYILADNRLAELAEWDYDLLSDELASLDMDFEDIGFDKSFLKADKVALTDEDEVPDAPADPKCKSGDIWLLGEHRLMCGDSCDHDALNALMGGMVADLLQTDPPYNVAYEGKTKDALTIQNDKMSNNNFRKFLLDAFTNANRVLKPGGVFYIWHADSEGYNFRGACFDAGWQVRQCLIWVKNSMVLGRQDHQWKHEPCLYGWKDGAAHFWGSDRKQTTVLEFDRPTRNTEHPTMKPVALIEYQVNNSSKPSEVVLDLFGGSGSTLIACEKNDRRCFTMELDPIYCDVIIKRWQEYTGQQAVHEKTREIF